MHSDFTLDCPIISLLTEYGILHIYLSLALKHKQVFKGPSDKDINYNLY